MARRTAASRPESHLGAELAGWYELGGTDDEPGSPGRRLSGEQGIEGGPDRVDVGTGIGPAVLNLLQGRIAGGDAPGA